MALDGILRDDPKEKQSHRQEKGQECHSQPALWGLCSLGQHFEVPPPRHTNKHLFTLERALMTA